MVGMLMLNRLVLVAAALSCLLTACSSYYLVKPASSPREGQAYLFGEFIQTGDSENVKACFVLENQDTGDEVTLTAKPGQPELLVAVEPGSYRLTEFYVETSFKDPERKVYNPGGCPRKLTSGFDVSENQVVYLGTHGVNTRIDQSYLPAKKVFQTRWSWSFIKSGYGFDAGTNRFLDVYQNFADMEFVDLRK